MNLQHWFTLEMLHDYFENDVCSVFKLLPMSSTQRIMKNYSIQINTMVNQYRGYIGTESSSSNIWEALETIDDLYFQLINTDSYFDNYTDVPTPREEDTILYLTTPLHVSVDQNLPITTYLPVQPLVFEVKLSSDSPVSVVIKNHAGQDIFNQSSQEKQSGMTVDINVFGTGVYELWVGGTLSKTFFGTSERVEDNCYGILHMQMTPIVEALKTNTALSFKVNFTARSSYWQYAVVISKDKKITVEDIGIEGFNNDIYTGPEKKMLGTQEGRLFTSPATIKLQQRARASPLLTMLYKNDFSDTIIELDMKMPVPGVSRIITKKQNNENIFYSQTIIYV